MAAIAVLIALGIMVALAQALIRSGERPLLAWLLAVVLPPWALVVVVVRLIARKGQLAPLPNDASEVHV